MSSQFGMSINEPNWYIAKSNVKTNINTRIFKCNIFTLTLKQILYKCSGKIYILSDRTRNGHFGLGRWITLYIGNESTKHKMMYAKHMKVLTIHWKDYNKEFGIGRDGGYMSSSTRIYCLQTPLSGYLNHNGSQEIRLLREAQGCQYPHKCSRKGR